ncbi:trichodiene synthase [Aspergillus terreus]|uniref:Trichodiene synthase n=1 Tax=Aspergillus terreus TaxID=33178 RepID=A0A5M3ZD49_ASPTE|nr:hypothetical protein ATETN484_0016011400 [Aspergillus terreus]GFF21543.1 trichodiene synthase [Aspergillus terreus]
MSEQRFPIDYFVRTVVCLLDTIQYKDTNYTHEHRLRNLEYVYSEAAIHFAQPCVNDALKVEPKKLEAFLRTTTRMVVYSWVKTSPKQMAALTIYYTYTAILNDSEDSHYPEMNTFYNDMICGRQQRHPWWRLVNKHLPNVLKHYGPFCAFNIYRSTLDYFEGRWIEQNNFHGYRGSEDYPGFLRRLNGLGHAVGASLWPSARFDEQELFQEITTAISMMEHWEPWLNDLLSFYKEFDDHHDQTKLINNYRHVEGQSVTEAVEKLAQNLLRVSEQVMYVFKDKDPRILDTLTPFMYGYVTWHLSDERYRMNEVYERVSENDEMGRKFCRYYEDANKVGRIDPAKWARLSVSE